MNAEKATDKDVFAMIDDCQYERAMAIIAMQQAKAVNRQAAALELIATTLCGNGAMTEQVERIAAALDKIAGKSGVVYTKSAGAE